MVISQILLDMDGVLCDFIGHTCTIMGMDGEKAKQLWPLGAWELSEGLGINDRQAWDAIDARGEDFWASIPTLPWFSELYETCLASCEKVVILTSPSLAHSSASGKVLWMQKHLGKSFRSYLIGPKKDVCARPGAVLIDDNDKNCSEFEKHGGRSIVFPAPWNSMRSQYPYGGGSPVPFVRYKLKEISCLGS